MIVDLLRNDLGRIARPGTVAVTELFGLERYPTVWQLASEVTARLREDVGLVDVLRALFPCGSVTGAPKARTMRLIRDLEPTPRGVYCGAIGMVAPPGAAFRARFGVAIRTAVVERASGRAVYGAGGGITWDSRADAERAELLTKSAVLRAGAGDHQLLETLYWSPAEGARHLARHLARLADSAAYFGSALDAGAVRAAIGAAVAGRSAPTRVRVTVARDGTVSVDVRDAPAAPDRPVTLAVDDVPVDPELVWLHHKTTRREVYAQRADRHPDADDVVLVNDRGEVTETTIATLAVRLAGRWWTPPTTSGCLPGVERAHLLDSGVLAERVLTVADLHAAEELALVSSLRGWRPAVLV
jgi:para-aminobenzoate synthetase/4-amino-4-deoxychorismate lyase